MHSIVSSTYRMYCASFNLFREVLTIYLLEPDSKSRPAGLRGKVKVRPAKWRWASMRAYSCRQFLGLMVMPTMGTTWVPRHPAAAKSVTEDSASFTRLTAGRKIVPYHAL